MVCTQNARFLRQFLGLALALSVPASNAIAEESKDQGPFKNLKFRSIGPAMGGRIDHVAGVAGDPLTYYAAGASSGVWKSTDGGLQWKPIFDDYSTASVGSIAVAPSDRNVIYIGTGEANIRANVVVGDGIYKSIDAGKTWKQVWKQEGQIGTMIVHPRNADIAFAAVLGHAFGPNGERGVYRTKDGGKSWQRVLHKDAETGASDVCFDPSNPNVLFAGLWQTRRRPWDLTSGGPGSGLYTSRDGGDTWKQLKEKGLPEGVWGKIGVAVAASDSRRVYAMIEADKGGLFRSDDGGETWQLASDSRTIRQRAWYYSTITVDPTNPDILWCPNVPMMKSVNGGKTFAAVRGFHHGDHHDMWIDPTNPRRMIDANDGGVDISTNGGESWYAPPLPLGQFYHVNVDNRTPYWVSGPQQDIGTAMGPSNSLNFAGINLSDWISTGAGETGYTVHDPSDFNIVYGGEYGGSIIRFDLRTRQPRNVSVYPDNPSGHGAADMKFRFRWPAPISQSPNDAKAIYHAANVVFKTTDGGMTWKQISPDLTRNDKSRQGWSGGPITGDNTTAEYYCTISAVAESPKQKDLIWVGSDDGLVNLTQDGGKTWTNVTANITGLPEWGSVQTIEPSPFQAGTAYVVVNAHMLDNRKPYLFKTTDFGKTWTNLAETMPADVPVHVLREDPAKEGLLYVGTDLGVQFSADAGKTWQPLKAALPTVPVLDMVVKGNDLVLATNGRSIWIFDDLTPLREWTPAVADSAVHLFSARPAIRWRLWTSIGRQALGENPPAGAVFHYLLKAKPKGEIRLELFDAAGQLVNKLTSKKTDAKEKAEGDDDDDDKDAANPMLPTEPGLHRVTWNLKYKSGRAIKNARIDAGDPTSAPFVLPGQYRANLVVGDQTFSTMVDVQPDPRSKTSLTDLAAQLKLSLATRDSFNKIADIVDQIRAVREQLKRQQPLVEANAASKELAKKVKAMAEKLDELENRLHNPKAQITYDILAQKGGAKIYSRLGLLDLPNDGDGAPTQGSKEIFAAISEDLAKCEKDWQSLQAVDLAALNREMKSLDVPHFIVPAVKKKD